MTLPARTIFFRSISRPIMNSMKISPSSAMVWIDVLGLDPARPDGPQQEAGDQIGKDQRLADQVGGDAKQPGHDDGQCQVVGEFTHGAPD